MSGKCQHGFEGCTECSETRLKFLETQVESLKEERGLCDRAWIKGAPHDVDDCPTFYDGCNCTIQTLDHNIKRAQIAEAEVERLKASMARHFTEEHLAGDGPEIDRWKALAKSNQREHDLVRHQRVELFEEGLITKEEYVALASELIGGMGRLVDYDHLQSRVILLEKALLEEADLREREATTANRDDDRDEAARLFSLADELRALVRKGKL